MTEYPLWTEIAFRELLLGVHEVAGPQHAQRIVDYHATTRGGATPDEIAWCSSAHNWVHRIAGVHGTNSKMARSWLAWGQGLEVPRLGCTVVLWRGAPDAASGHVAQLLRSAGQHVQLLGGNQHDAWTVESFPADRVLGYRWPRPQDYFL